jgi:hypothetical protein
VQIREINDVLHKIEAKLYPNYLGKGEGANVARVKAEAPLPLKTCAPEQSLWGIFRSLEYLVEHSNVFI